MIVHELLHLKVPNHGKLLKHYYVPTSLTAKTSPIRSKRKNLITLNHE
ncbi:MAG: hypothetical protein ACO1QB_04320 [Verrucomicrobiales bacterium]